MSATRVLIVDDNEDIAQMLREFFTARNYLAHIALDGGNAMELARQIIPHLILLDVNLPDTDGFTLFKRIRAINRLRYTPIIFVSRRGKREERLAGLELGAEDYINKPFDLEELFLRAQNVIERSVREHLTDPRTGLPSATIVRQELALLPEGGRRHALEFRLRNLAAFSDRYGPLAAADVVRYTALLLNAVLDELGEHEDFLGQSDDEAFTLICSTDRLKPIGRLAVERFDGDVTKHYSMARKAGPGQVKVTDTLGRTFLLPIMRLEVAELDLP